MLCGFAGFGLKPCIRRDCRQKIACVPIPDSKNRRIVVYVDPDVWADIRGLCNNLYTFGIGSERA